jgi:uncharacterized protein (TIGR02391 family)
MTESEIQAEAVDAICARFINLGKTTPRRFLITKFRAPEAISGLVSQRLARTVGAANDEHYIPLARAFARVADPAIGARAKTAAVVALHVLRSLYEVELDKDTFSSDDAVQHARKLYDAVDQDTVKLGLYLCPEFGVFKSWSSSHASMEISSFSLAERIITITNPEAEWDALTRTDEPQVRTVEIPATEEEAPPIPDDLIDWRLLHPAVVEVAESRFRSGHFADSVEAALKSVNERVREIVQGVIGAEMDGSDLMQRAFAPKQPVFKLGDLGTATGRSMQVGYLQIFAGAMTGIRNPKAHGNIVIDPVRAIHFLYLASLLMCKLDEAEICKADAASDGTNGQ